MELAERTGLIVSVGAGLLDLACYHIASWGEDAPHQVSVSLSSRQVNDPRLPELVQSALNRHTVKASQLCLDVSERIIVDCGERLLAKLGRLKELGVGLAVDDFGSGGASLRYLRDAQVDALKIDPAFVAGLGHDGGDTEVVRAFIGLGDALGLTTIATGVDDADQAGVLRDLGCKQALGLYFGAPVLAEEVTL
jgi:EAL domain-containing protein (putative c-di-GMP-specific phosphodiesterase class I)